MSYGHVVFLCLTPEALQEGLHCVHDFITAPYIRVVSAFKARLTK